MAAGGGASSRSITATLSTTFSSSSAFTIPSPSPRAPPVTIAYFISLLPHEEARKQGPAPAPIAGKKMSSPHSYFYLPHNPFSRKAAAAFRVRPPHLFFVWTSRKRETHGGFRIRVFSFSLFSRSRRLAPPHILSDKRAAAPRIST